MPHELHLQVTPPPPPGHAAAIEAAVRVLLGEAASVGAPGAWQQAGMADTIDARTGHAPTPATAPAGGQQR